MKKKILFIYGFGGSPDSTFCKLIREALPDDSYEVLCPAYPQDDIKTSREQLTAFIEQEHIDLVIGTSLGGFIALSLPTHLPRIALNPCMMPSVELPKLEPRPDHPEDKKPCKELVEACKAIEAEVNNGKFNTSQRCVGLFAQDDEYLGTKYKEGFERAYHVARFIPGGHHGNPKAIPSIVAAIEQTLSE